jgi:hypothetical protein
MSRAMWLIVLALAGIAVGVGIAIHPALIVGGALVAAIALAKTIQDAWASR